jgi:hypothetical protein
LLPSDSDHRVERIWADFESVEAYIIPEASISASASGQEEEEQAVMKTELTIKKVEVEGVGDVKVEYVPMSGPGSRSGKAFQVCLCFLCSWRENLGFADKMNYLVRIFCLLNCTSRIMNRIYKLRLGGGGVPLPKVQIYFLFYPQTNQSINQDGPALIILSILTANIRNCTLPSYKLKALDVFLALASHLTDEAKLDRMVPFVVELLHDEAALVRVGAIRCLMQVVSMSSLAERRLLMRVADGKLAHVSHSDHTLECVHLSGIYHSQYQASNARYGGVCKVCVCAVHERIGGYGGAVFGDGTSVEGPWGVQVGAWNRDGGRRSGRI